MSITFISNTRELTEALHFVWAPHARKKKILPTIQVAIELYEDSLMLNAFGSISHVKCQRTSKEMWRVVLPLDYFYQVTKSFSKPEISISIEDDRVTCENFSFRGAIVTKLDIDQKNVLVQIPINFEPNDILALRAKYSIQDLTNNRLLSKVEKYEDELNTDITRALKFLSKYDLSHKDLVDLIYDKIK